MNLLDYIFPKYCVSCRKSGDYLCASCFSLLSFDTKAFCLVCNKATFNNLTHPKCLSKHSINGCFLALTYSKISQKLIYNFKYKPFLTDLRKVLADLFYESIIQNETFVKLIEKNEWLIVSIPLSSNKLKKRGYNQAEILAEDLSNRLNIPKINALKRIKEPKTQVGLANVDRKINIKDAFIIHNSKFITKNTSLFLVDDVVITGSTLLEAARVLKKSGAKNVFGLTLARD